ncbi:hypothetical protein Meth11DRAFT_0544 [Methylophilaceae bacterium 11]|jgi:hypothetical protein|uniref:hypothetical protein n=1 Tax=Methylotenera sp. N17 TaxID=1502761 RepID=UPI000448B631|nr:hypothetical protein [Methylotenera sp. N17]EUJ09743.1 hypothetical protein Meth11DRAFT_0544 [Methylophilaceae bacterium 11]
MKKIIAFCGHKIRGLQAFIAVIKENRLITVLLAGILFSFAAIAESLIGRATEYFFPQLDDSAAIIANQNQQFDAVKENLKKLQSAISGQDKAYLNSALDAVSSIKQDSENLSIKLAALQEENASLKQTLKSQKGVYGGVDLMVPDKSGFKIDSQVSFGHSIFRKGSYVTLTSLNQADNTKNKYLTAGQGTYFTNEKNQHCALTLNSITQVAGSKSGVANFIVSCKT